VLANLASAGTQPLPEEPLRGEPVHCETYFRRNSMTLQNQQHLPPQSQERQPGRESEMIPKPAFEPRFRGADKLKDKVALVPGGDSGIGRAVAIHMAREGADVAIVYLEEHNDAAETARLVKAA
jgi:hypothetical protein